MYAMKYRYEKYTNGQMVDTGITKAHVISKSCGIRLIEDWNRQMPNIWRYALLDFELMDNCRVQFVDGPRLGANILYNDVQNVSWFNFV